MPSQNDYRQAAQHHQRCDSRPCVVCHQSVGNTGNPPVEHEEFTYAPICEWCAGMLGLLGEQPVETPHVTV